MAWVIWRQHRLALIGMVVALAAIGAYTWSVGLQLHHAYAAELACHPAGSDACFQLTSGFNSLGGFLTNGWILQLVPALIGAFVGAPVLAREMETGTYRYAWTQGFGRWRWALAKLAGACVGGDRRGRRHQRAVLLVLPAVLRRAQSDPGPFRVDFARTQPVRFARGRVRRLDACRLRDRRPGRHADPSGRPGDCRHPGRVCRTGHRDRGMVAGALFRQS